MFNYKILFLMGNICCCIREDNDKTTIRYDITQTYKHITADSDVEDIKVKSNQKIILSSKINNFTDFLQEKTLTKIVKIQSLIRGFLSRNTLYKNNEKKSNISNSFVSNNNLNHSTENYYTLNREKVIQVKDQNASPLNFKDNVRRLFKPITLNGGKNIYDGEWLNAKRDGFGILTWEDGAKFIGFFKNDMTNGLGTQIHKRGEIYLGQWVNDRAEGLGYFISSNKQSRYEGEWRGDKHNGFGCQIQLKGSIYTGEFSNGLKEGKGILRLEDDSYYEGEFSKNEISGIGRFTYHDGKQYSGEWKANRMHGYGILFYNSEKSFEGEFCNDKKHGFGIFKNLGKTYLGNFINDKLEGEVLIIENGKERNSFWKDGKKVSYLETVSKYSHLSNAEI